LNKGGQAFLNQMLIMPSIHLNLEQPC